MGRDGRWARKDLALASDAGMDKLASADTSLDPTGSACLLLPLAMELAILLLLLFIPEGPDAEAETDRGYDILLLELLRVKVGSIPANYS